MTLFLISGTLQLHTMSEIFAAGFESIDLFQAAWPVVGQEVVKAIKDFFLSGFKFHPKCLKVKLTHLCFANDLLIFSEASLSSINVIKAALVEFDDLSGLKANPSKSSFYCSGILDRIKQVLLNALQMKEGKLPVRYLGVPLISSRLSYADCGVLLERITRRIDSWLFKNLSYVIKAIEQKFNRFLWNGKDMEAAKAKVALNDICFPKKEGGLELKRIDVWNKTSMLRHIWSLFARSSSLWVAWIKANFLKHKSFWSVNIPQNCSWCWRKLLRLRDTAMKFLRFEVGDGRNIHLWLDLWHPNGILLEKYGFRVVYDAHSSVEAKLFYVIHNGEWFWRPARSEAWWIFKLGLLKSVWVLVINLFGLLLGKVSM
ncbi:uncharacterized protein LOC132167566 [Corylus avellana]|uniref:uncharacterized protein LOC132167566 n=1 Tax=Corylus avellana TaxID=13451 RepID=UPI00286A74F1|nr:uncharacterized protein LOC132167566 [Corylus avellana]